jgi:hypothetical protein
VLLEPSGGVFGLRRLACVLLAVSAAVVVGCGCSSSESKSRAPSVTIPPAPSFNGPYAEEFMAAWDDPSNPSFVRAVLADGKITDEEWAEVAQRLGRCLKAKGLTFKGFRPDGSYAVATGNVSGDQANADLPGCEKASGEQAIGFLRTAMATNPDNEPAAQIMTECLIRLHVVGPDYTQDDYLRDAPTMSFPYLDPKTGKANFERCNADPTTGLGSK